MAGLRNLDGYFWHGFRTETDGKERYFLGNDNNTLYLTGKEFFNKNTISVTVYKGVEVADLSCTKVISDEEILLISLWVKISNYFGDRNGRHNRNKIYVKIGEKIYLQNEYGNIKEVVRLSKELKGILRDIEVARL